VVGDDGEAAAHLPEGGTGAFYWEKDQQRRDAQLFYVRYASAGFHHAV